MDILEYQYKNEVQQDKWLNEYLKQESKHIIFTNFWHFLMGIGYFEDLKRIRKVIKNVRL